MLGVSFDIFVEIFEILYTVPFLCYALSTVCALLVCSFNPS